MNNKLDRQVFVGDLKVKFALHQVSGNEESLKRWIIAPDINRPGLELAGFEVENDLKRVEIIGAKEMAYITTLDAATQRARFETITDAYTPCIIITHGNQAPPILLDVAEGKNFPVFETEESTHRLSVQVIAFLDEKLAPMTLIHGVMMNINGVGVLLKGESGIGKSELALELVSRGHSLVADDRVDMLRMHNFILCKAPQILRNLLEIRGIGVIDLSRIYGSVSTLNETRLDLIINLEHQDGDYDPVKLGFEAYPKCEVLGLAIPYINISVKEGRAMGVIIETAVANFRLQQLGYNSALEFKEKLREFINSQKEEN